MSEDAHETKVQPTRRKNVVTVMGELVVWRYHSGRSDIWVQQGSETLTGLEGLLAKAIGQEIGAGPTGQIVRIEIWHMGRKI